MPSPGLDDPRETNSPSATETSIEDRWADSQDHMVVSYREAWDTPEYRLAHLDEYPEWQREAIREDAIATLTGKQQAGATS